MILIICGPPAVGKSAVAQLLQERLANLGLTYRLLDSDQFSRDTYDRMFERVANAEGDWILAGTFYKSDFLAPFEALDDVVVVLLEADLETCLERNRRREDSIDEAAVHIIWREFETPDADFEIDVVKTSPEAVVDRLINRLDFGDDRS